MLEDAYFTMLSFNALFEIGIYFRNDHSILGTLLASYENITRYVVPIITHHRVNRLFDSLIRKKKVYNSEVVGIQCTTQSKQHARREERIDLAAVTRAKEGAKLSVLSLRYF